MSRKLLLSSISIAATAALLGAGGFAMYSDTEQSATATVTAGTLNLEVGGTAVGQSYSVTNAYPGYKTGTANGFVLYNTGSLAGSLHVFLVKDADDEGGVAVEPEIDGINYDATGGEIDNYLNVTVDGNRFGYEGEAWWVSLANASIGERVDITPLIWGGDTPPIVIPAYGQYPNLGYELLFGWEISTDADNAIMTDTLGFHLEFTLEQV